jgi:hypothetical protein
MALPTLVLDATGVGRVVVVVGGLGDVSGPVPAAESATAMPADALLPDTSPPIPPPPVEDGGASGITNAKEFADNCISIL